MELFNVMPNHVHIIFQISCPKGSIGKTTLSSVVGSYKSGVTRRIRERYPNISVWQRSYHDRIIRNQKEYEMIWNYVAYNHLKWCKDCFHPDRRTR